MHTKAPQLHICRSLSAEKSTNVKANQLNIPEVIQIINCISASVNFCLGYYSKSSHAITVYTCTLHTCTANSGSLLLYGFVARRCLAISLSSVSTSFCFSSAVLRRALAFLTNTTFPDLSHFLYISVELDTRDEI